MLIAKPYKLPLFWLGQKLPLFMSKGIQTDDVITPDMVEGNCHCKHELQALFCTEGHMFGCHVGMDCAHAVCDHYVRQKYNEENEV